MKDRFNSFRWAVSLGVSLVALVAALAAQAGEKVVGSVAIITSEDSPPYRETIEGFQHYMEAHRPAVTVKVHALGGGNGADVTDQIRRSAPVVLLTLGNSATTFALTELSDIPAVAALVLDMAQVREAPNATGVDLDFSLETTLSWLARILPDHQSVGVIYDPRHNQRTLQKMDLLALDFDLSIEAEGVSTTRDVRAGLHQLARRSDVFLGIPDPTVFSPQTAKQLLLFSFQQEIPLVGLSSAWVKAGALYALERDYRDVGNQCGGLAVKILNGTPARALPSQTPRSVLYDINLRTAEQMGITLSDEIRQKARKVFR